jgi:lipopolysaccharide/colanic/teichoic acid biosynthesis glycosyltransferase
MYLLIKRGMDILMAGVGLVILCPFLFLIGAIIYLNDRGPIFYRAKRVGRGGNEFTMYKFRTMIANADSRGASSTTLDDVRITALGKVLRKWKLDELAQLLNVFMGSMSLVGPRPQVRWAVDKYSSKEKNLLTIRPGITDFASLAFPNEEEILKGSSDPDADYMAKIHPLKMQLSLKYLKEMSLWVDIKIILQTIKRVVNPFAKSKHENL